MVHNIYEFKKIKKPILLIVNIMVEFFVLVLPLGFLRKSHFYSAVFAESKQKRFKQTINT